jgi:hypothetical protein
MTFVPPERVPIDRVDGPGQAWLGLRGTILLFHKHTFVFSSTSFIPVEWVSIQQGSKRDSRRLLRGFLSFMLTILLALPIGLLELRMRPLSLLDRAMELILGLLLLFMFGLALGLLTSYLRPRPMLSLGIEGQPADMAIRFWAYKKDTKVQTLLDRLRNAQQKVVEDSIYPIPMSHIFHRQRPFRIALVKGFTISFVLYVGLALLSVLQRAGIGPYIPKFPYLLLFLLLPPLFYTAMVAFRKSLLMLEPRSFRLALRCYEREEMKASIEHLCHLLSECPDHDDGRFLMVRALSVECDFEEALKHCDLLSRDHPALAKHLQANLWGIRRMHGRMQEE